MERTTSPPPPPPTAFALREMAAQGAHGVVLHRCSHLTGHDTDAATSATCWCEPLVLDGNQMRWAPIRALQMMLDEHFRVH